MARKISSEKPARVAVVVLGMHRSGTSALTRTLSLLGCDLPRTLMGANGSNQAGHWESIPICRFNDRILESAGSRWQDWTEVNPGWSGSLKADAFREEALTLLQDEFGDSRFFVLKDPRICRLAGFWGEIFDAAGVRPVVAFITRNPLEVAASIADRNGIDRSLGHLMWLRHVLDAEHDSRGKPRFFTSYDRLLTGWRQVAEQAGQALDLIWPRMSAHVVDEIEGFLTHELRHHREATSDVVENPSLSEWLRSTYAILDRWAADGEDPQDFATLDRIRTEFNAATPAFARVVTAGEAAMRGIRALERNNAEAQAKLEQVQANLDGKVEALRAKLEDRDGQIEEAEQALSEIRGRLSETESALAQRRHEAEQTAAELKAAREEAENAAAEKDAELGKAQSELANANAARSEAEARLKERFDEIATLTKMLKDNEAESERQRAVLEKRLSEQAAEGAALRKLAEAKAAEASQVSQAAAEEIGRTVSTLLNGSRWKLLPAPLRLRRQMAVLRRSGLFDAEWYVRAYQDVAESGVDPLRHYVQFGAREGRHPNRTLSVAGQSAGHGPTAPEDKGS